MNFYKVTVRNIIEHELLIAAPSPEKAQEKASEFVEIDVGSIHESLVFYDPNADENVVVSESLNKTVGDSVLTIEEVDLDEGEIESNFPHLMPEDEDEDEDDEDNDAPSDGSDERRM